LAPKRRYTTVILGVIPADAKGGSLTGAAGILTWHHTSIVVDNLDQAVAFHRDQFGFVVVLEARGMAEPIQRMLGLTGITCDLIQAVSPVSNHFIEFIEFHNRPPGVNEMLPIWPGRAHTAFVVTDIERALSTVTASGGRPIGEITDFPEGPAVYCWAPGGGVIELEEHLTAAGRPQR
jgi:Glyoxalase/Bleomycin resistance protein/Dioxygenase superfamily